MRQTSAGRAVGGNGENGLHRQRRLLISATALGTVLIGLAVAPSAALAACTPVPDDQDNQITCDGSPNAALNALGGNDVVNYRNGDGTQLKGGSGDDTIFFRDGLLVGLPDPTPGQPQLAAIQGNEGDDNIQLLGGVIGSMATPTDVAGDTGNINAPGGKDTILLDGATVYGNLRADGGDENWFTLKSGAVRNGDTRTSDIIGSNGVDHIRVAPDAGKSVTIEGAINAGAGDDDITLIVQSADASAFVKFVDGRQGVDTITLQGAVIGTTGIAGGEGGDTIRLISGTVQGNVLGDRNGPTLDDGDDVISLEGATVNSFIRGNAGNDRIDLLSGKVGGGVLGDLGNDVITVGVRGNPSDAGPEVGTVVSGDDPGSPGVGGVDTITMYSGVVGSISGDAGNDTIELYGGRVGKNSPGSVNGGMGEDTINLYGGTAGAVNGGDDSDTIVLEGSTVTSLSGGGGNDIINLKSGAITTTGTAVSGGDGNDQITLESITIAGAISGASGNDSFNLISASVKAVSGGTGNDSLNWTGGSLSSFDGEDGSDVALVTAAAYDGSQTLDGGDDTSPTDGFVDELTIRGKTITSNGEKIVNWETVTLDGTSLTLSDGKIAVSGDVAETAGLFLTNGSSLIASAPLALTGNLSMGAGSVLQQLVAGSENISGRLVNQGTVDLRNGSSADVLAVGNGYAGGGALLVEVAGDQSDLMAVQGDVSGPATVISAKSIAAGNTGAPITVVSVTGNTRDGDFTAGTFDLGLYSYSLTLNDKLWQFVAADASDGATLYPSVNEMLSLFTRETVATHFERTGSWARARVRGEEQGPDDQVTTLAGGDRDAPGKVWLRAIGQWGDGEGKLKGGPAEFGNQKISYDRDIGGVQGGVDVIVSETASYLVTVGLFGQTGRMNGSARNDTKGSSAGSVESDAWGLGASIGVDTKDSYAEVVGGWNNYDISTSTRSGSANTDGTGYFVSFEAGYEYAVNQTLTLIPQAQIAYVGTDVDNFTDPTGTPISYGGDDGAVGRLGLAIDAKAGTFNDQPLRLTGIFNYWQDFSDAPQTFVNGTALEIDQTGGTLEAGAAFHWGTAQAPMHLHGQLTYRDAVGGDGEQSWNATAGLRIAF